MTDANKKSDTFTPFTANFVLCKKDPIIKYFKERGCTYDFSSHFAYLIH